jgi:4-hydroxy-tetrahydrodipicolinate synthase
MHKLGLRGVFVPVVTPFTRDFQVDRQRYLGFCRWLVSQEAGLAAFGTNSEAASLAFYERRELLAYLVENGIDPARLMPGTGTCSLPETVALTQQAVALGCAGVLMLPPFYYKGQSDADLFRYYASVIDAVGSGRLRIYLYHIPQFTGVPISLPLIERLVQAYPDTVVGIKDSSGDWANTEAMLKAFPDFSVFPASEALLEKALPMGAAGCISATANVQPGAIAGLIREWSPQRQVQVSALRAIVQAYPMIPALKAIIAHYAGDAGWGCLRPPLGELATAQVQSLLDKLAECQFVMPGLAMEVNG